MSSGQPKTVETKTSQVSEPFPEAKPYYLDLYKKASEALGQTNKNPFTGDFVATPGADFSNALGMLRGNVAAGNVGYGANEVKNLAMDTLTGKYMMPDSNPFLKAAGEAATRPLMENFTNTILPAITDQSIAQGAYGGTGADITKARATGEVSTAIGDVLAKMYAQNYQQERQNQLNAPGMVMQSYDFFKEPAMELMRIDEASRAARQSEIDNTLAKFNETQQAPWYGLGEMAQILASGGFRSTTGSVVGPNPNYENPFMSALKIGMGGLASVASLGGKGGFGFWGR